MDPAASNPTPPLSTFTPQSDSSKYIRTYAKDVAAISGVPEIKPTPAPAAPAPAPVPEKATSVDSGVTLPDYDPSPVNNTDPASPKEFAQEKVDLTAADSEGIFAKVISKVVAPAPAPFPEPSHGVPLMPQAAIAPAANIQPPETDADREAILARLRAKVAAQPPLAPPEPPAPLPTPVFVPAPEPVPSIPQVQKPETTPSPIHTYSSDFADRIDTEKSSTFSVLAAQSDAGQNARPAGHKRNFLPLLAGAAMLLIGIAAIVGAYIFTQHGNTVPTVAGIPSLIPFDESVEVKGTGPALMQAISDVGQGGVVSGNTVVTYVTLATTTGSGIPQPGGVLIQNLELSAPDILLRNIADTSTVGVIHADTETRPFLVLKVNSYERTFAGMLAWEPTMRSSLATLFPPYASVVTVSTSTGSTTPAISKPAPTMFVDAVVANYDVRILRDASGRSLLLYGYRGKDVLIIARNEAAFTALVSRLAASGH